MGALDELGLDVLVIEADALVLLLAAVVVEVVLVAVL